MVSGGLRVAQELQKERDNLLANACQAHSMPDHFRVILFQLQDLATSNAMSGKETLDPFTEASCCHTSFGLVVESLRRRTKVLAPLAMAQDFLLVHSS